MEQTSPQWAVGEVAARPAGLLAGRRKLYVAVAMLALAIGYFGFTAFQSATVFYLTVDELLQGQAQPGETVRVSGKLVPGSFQREEKGTTAYFSLAGERGVLEAELDGIVPELFFNEHSEIVLHGSYAPAGDGGTGSGGDSSNLSGNGTAGVFVANSVVVKCPSKYEAREE